MFAINIAIYIAKNIACNINKTEILLLSYSTSSAQMFAPASCPVISNVHTSGTPGCARVTLRHYYCSLEAKLAAQFGIE